jgi:hypothetical protein
MGEKMGRLILLVFVVSIFLPSIATANGEEIQAICGYRNLFFCGKQIEPILLARHPEIASRNGDALTLSVGQSKPVIFKNIDCECESAVEYHLVGRILVKSKPGYLLVSARRWEGHGYVLVHQATGKLLSVQSMPIVSTDGERFVDLSLDLEAGYLPNYIRIYRLQHDGQELEWSKSFSDSGPSDAVWLDSKRLILVENRISQLHETPFEVTRKALFLTKAGGDWSLSPAK